MDKIKIMVILLIGLIIGTLVGYVMGYTAMLDNLHNCGTKYCIRSWWQGYSWNQSVTVLYCEIYSDKCYLGGEF